MLKDRIIEIFVEGRRGKDERPPEKSGSAS